MPGKPLTGSVAIQAEALVETNDLPATENFRHADTGTSPELPGQHWIVEDTAIVVSRIRTDFGTTGRHDRRRLKSASLSSLDQSQTFVGIEKIVDGVDA